MGVCPLAGLSLNAGSPDREILYPKIMGGKAQATEYG